ncbi:restriction endonuclease subunit S [Streptococcus suis]|nr:restriction endonuclease subunit S [Streptococcus suis]
MPNKDRNIPKRRFKEFENADAWELRPLGEIGNTYTGLSGKTKDDFGHGDGRFVTYMNVFSNPISLPEMVEAVEIDESQNTVRYGDVLFTTSSETPEEVGMSSVWLENTENTYLNSFCFGFRPVKKVNPYYLAYLLRSSGMRRKISFLAQGISRYNISKTKMMELKISIPNENEQEVIGTFFSTLDRHITLHQRKLDKLKSVKQAYLSEMFPAEGERVPKRRFPGFTDDWELRKLGEVGTVAMCRRIFKEQTSEHGEIPFYKIGTFGGTPDAFIARELFEEFKDKYSYPNIGDILISASGSIGRTVEFLGEDEYFQDSNIVWLKHDGKINNIFLKQFYSIVKWSGIEGSTIKRLYNENILNTEISLPTLPEQKAIGSFFSTLDRQITLHQRKLEKLKNLKKALLNELFV